MATLAELRSQLLDQVGSDPTPGVDTVRRVNGHISRAYVQMVKDLPFLFHEEEIRFKVEPPVESTLSTDTVSCLSEEVQSGGADVIHGEIIQAALASGSTTGQVEWPYDRTWDGRDIELIDPTTSEVVHRTRIRTISRETTQPIISLQVPVNHAVVGTGPFAYRIFTQVEWLPHDVIEWRSGRVVEKGALWPLEVLGQSEAESRWLVEDYDSTASGEPRYLFRRGFFQLPGPRRAAGVSLGDTASTNERWKGPEPSGTFSYRFTFTWGKRSQDFRTAGIGLFDDANTNWQFTDDNPLTADLSRSTGYYNRVKPPRWESAPSPATSLITPTAMPDAATWSEAIKLTLPAWEYEQGFGFFGKTGNDVTMQRENFARSGIHVRIYRRRHSAPELANYTSLGGTTKQAGTHIGNNSTQLSALDWDDGYYLLAEIPYPFSNHNLWFDTGEITPDRNVRLPNINGYQGIRWYPQPDETYTIGVRVLRRPEPLESDNDIPRIVEDGNDAIIYRALTYFYEAEGSFAAADRARKLFEKEVANLAERYGDLRPDNVVVYRRPARAASYRGIGRRWWKRGNP